MAPTDTFRWSGFGRRLRLPAMSFAGATGLYVEGRSCVAAPEPSAAPPPIATGPSGDPTTVVLVVEATIASADVRALADRMQDLTEGRALRVVLCDVGVIVEPDIATVDALARLALGARRAGCRVGLRHASPELRGLLALTGFGEVLPCDGGSGVEARGQPEEREEVRGVQEERDPADPIA